MEENKPKIPKRVKDKQRLRRRIKAAQRSARHFQSIAAMRPLSDLLVDIHS